MEAEASVKRINNLHGKRLLAFLIEKLRKHPDVVGVTTSRRIRDGKELAEECITIFVKAKVHTELLPAQRKLPRYFNLRNKDGSIDRTKRIYTDIIQIGQVKSIAAGGSGIIVLGENGTITMAFQTDGDQFLLSNRHVLAPHIDQQQAVVQIRDDSGLVSVATLNSYFQTEQENGKEFIDAGLAKVEASSQTLIQIYAIKNGASSLSIKKMRTLKSRETGNFWFSGSQSGVRSGTIMDILVGGGAWKVEYAHLGVILVDRLYALKVSAIQGDSGAPVYETSSDGTATLVGIVVATAQDNNTGTNLVLFHSIVDVENGFKRLLKKQTFSFL